MRNTRGGILRSASRSTEHGSLTTTVPRRASRPDSRLNRPRALGHADGQPPVPRRSSQCQTIALRGWRPSCRAEWQAQQAPRRGRMETDQVASRPSISRDHTARREHGPRRRPTIARPDQATPAAEELDGYRDPRDPGQRQVEAQVIALRPCRSRHHGPGAATRAVTTPQQIRTGAARRTVAMHRSGCPRR